MMLRRTFRFQLYVAGDAPNSTQAVACLNKLCREHLAGRHEIEVVDVFREPGRALAAGIFMTPTLDKFGHNATRVRIVGNLSQKLPLMRPFRTGRSADTQPYPPEDVQEEIAALIATLHETGQRLELLTGGEVDSVVDAGGRNFLLQSAQERLRHIEIMKRAAVLDALPAHIAMLDAEGSIVSLNDAWRHYPAASSLQGPDYGLGTDYLAVCDRARGEGISDAHRAAAGIRAVLAGTSKRFSLEYPCHALNEKRWFLMSVTPVGRNPPTGAVVMHLDITDRKLTELQVIATHNQMLETLDAIPDLLFELGLNGRYYDYRSPRIEPQAAPTENLIGRTIFEVLPPDAAYVVSAALQEANAKGFSMGRQFEMEIAQGYKSFELSISRKATMPGQQARFICLSRDITQRKEAEDFLRQRTLELERFSKLSVGRELQMIELKEELNALAITAGETPPHNLEFCNPQPGRADYRHEKSA